MLKIINEFNKNDTVEKENTRIFLISVKKIFSWISKEKANIAKKRWYVKKAVACIK